MKRANHDGPVEAAGRQEGAGQPDARAARAERTDAGLSQVERAYREIKSKIVYGTYRPGAHLSESTLARVHHTSRTPIREALSRLSEEGYVVSDPGRGFVIAPITLSVVRNLFQVRRLLEGAAAAFAAEAATTEEIEQMERVASYEYQPGHSESYRTALGKNIEFHMAVASGSHNEVLADLIRRCLMQLDRVLSLGADFARFHELSSDAHLAITEAIRSRNPRRAREEAEHHSDHTSQLMLEALLKGGIKGVVL